MRIKNNTHHCTADIAKLIRRVAQDELQPGQLKHARVTVKYQRRGSRRLGYCFIGTMLQPKVRMKLLLPRGGYVDTVKLAHTIAHELGHAKGLRHPDMRNGRYGYADDWRDWYRWAISYTVLPEDVRVQLRTQGHGSYETHNYVCQVPSENHLLGADGPFKHRRT
jgi:hypothetical protein